MSEQKSMRDALEAFLAYDAMSSDDGVALMVAYEGALKLARKALAQQPVAVVELTDAEISALAGRIYFDMNGYFVTGQEDFRVRLVREAIAAHEAKKNGGGK